MIGRYKDECLAAVSAVREAARLCRAVGGGIAPEALAKKDRSPVTVADFGSQALICRALGAAFPRDPIIAEEGSAELRAPQNRHLLDQVVDRVRAVRGAPDLSADTVCAWIDRGGESEHRPRFWTLDPIDGTKGFLRGEQYAVALALIVDGEIAVAALACPNLGASVEGKGPIVPNAGPRAGSVFFAVRGAGAFATDGDDAAGDAPPVSIRTSDRDDPSIVRFCESVESGHSAHGDAAAIAAQLGITAPPLRMDSQAKYAVVARGEADVYLRMPTRADYREKIWDHAAGALIVREAGGEVTDIDGSPLEFRHGRELAVNRGAIVTNGRLHARVVEAVRRLGLGQPADRTAPSSSD